MPDSSTPTVNNTPNMKPNWPVRGQISFHCWAPKSAISGRAAGIVTHGNISNRLHRPTTVLKRLKARGGST